MPRQKNQVMFGDKAGQMSFQFENQIVNEKLKIEPKSLNV